MRHIWSEKQCEIGAKTMPRSQKSLWNWATYIHCVVFGLLICRMTVEGLNDYLWFLLLQPSNALQYLSYLLNLVKMVLLPLIHEGIIKLNTNEDFFLFPYSSKNSSVRYCGCYKNWNQKCRLSEKTEDCKCPVSKIEQRRSLAQKRSVFQWHGRTGSEEILTGLNWAAVGKKGPLHALKPTIYL